MSRDTLYLFGGVAIAAIAAGYVMKLRREINSRGAELDSYYGTKGNPSNSNDARRAANESM